MSDTLANVRRYFPNVQHVRDAKESIAIEVTPQDANPSKKRKHSECAMAVAAKRNYKLDGVIVSRSLAFLVKGTEAVRYQLPPSVAKEVVSFDRGGGFAPGSYKLSRPTKAHRLGSRKNRKGYGAPNMHPGEGDPIKMRHATEGIREVLGFEGQ